MGMTEELERYLEGYDGLLGRKENRENFRRFARGQLGPVERKSLEPIADAAGVPPRVLQEFFSEARWDEGGGCGTNSSSGWPGNTAARMGSSSWTRPVTPRRAK